MAAIDRAKKVLKRIIVLSEHGCQIMGLVMAVVCLIVEETSRCKDTDLVGETDFPHF